MGRKGQGCGGGGGGGGGGVVGRLGVELRWVGVEIIRVGNFIK